LKNKEVNKVLVVAIKGIEKREGGGGEKDHRRRLLEGKRKARDTILDFRRTIVPLRVIGCMFIY
jgi:hypothetical protein